MIATITDRVPALKVLGTQRNFTLLWSGQFVSAVGDGLFKVALAWSVLQVTGSALAMGTVFLASLVPEIALTLFGGVAADCLPRRLILLWSDTGRAVVVAAIAVLAWFHVLAFWHLLLLSLLFGIADSFFQPAYQSVVPQLIQERPLLQSANALIQGSSLVSRVIGPLLGAVLVAVAGGAASAFAVDAGSFVFSAVCLVAVHLPPASRVSGEGEARQGILADIRAGIRYVVATPWLWITIALAALSNVTFSAPFASVLPKLVHDVYGAGPWLFGLLVAADGMGSLVAALMLSFLHVPRRGIFAYSSLLVSCLGLVALGLPAPLGKAPLVATIACVLIGFGIGVFMILEMTLLQELVPDHLLGRVFSIDTLGSFALLPVGLVMVGWLADHLGPAPVFLLGGLLSLGLAAAGLCVRDIRALR